MGMKLTNYLYLLLKLGLVELYPHFLTIKTTFILTMMKMMMI
jgi:hypothetical protein